MFQPTVWPEDLDHVLAHTRADWEGMRGQRIFITGGTGYFGIWLLESFLWASERLNLNAEATVLTRDPAAFARRAPHIAAERAVRFVPGDIKDFPFPDGDFPFVIHAATAASAQLNDEQPLEMLDVNIVGTRRVLDFAAAHGTKRLLFTSSGAVYGPQPEGSTHVSEDYLGAPNQLARSSAYNEGKRVAEFLCSVYDRQYGINTMIARCYAQVGPYLPLDIHYAMGNFLRDALAGGPIVIRGDGTPFRSYMYGSDLAIWLWTILFRGKSCRPYNVGSDEDIRLADLAQRISKAVGGVEVQVLGMPISGSAPSRYVPSIDRARKELDLDIHVSLEEAIQKTLRYVRKDLGCRM